jgi:vacuolar-type H+-ATPase subunit F/Vma7
MRILLIGGGDDALGFGLAGVRTGVVEQADEETIAFVSSDEEFLETAALVVRLPAPLPVSSPAREREPGAAS